jgi:hypothetical protein
MGAIVDIECLEVVLNFMSFKYIVIVYSAIKSGPVILQGTLYVVPLLDLIIKNSKIS